MLVGKEDFDRLSSWVGLEGNFSGAFPVQLPGGRVDVCKNQLMELMVNWWSGGSGEWTAWNPHILWPVFVAIFWISKMFYITPKLAGNFLQFHVHIFSNGWFNHQLEPWKIPKEWMGSVFSWISWNFMLVWTCTWVKNFRIPLKENNEQLPLLEKQHLRGDSKWAFLGWLSDPFNG